MQPVKQTRGRSLPMKPPSLPNVMFSVPKFCRFLMKTSDFAVGGRTIAEARVRPVVRRERAL